MQTCPQTLSVRVVRLVCACSLRAEHVGREHQTSWPSEKTATNTETLFTKRSPGTPAKSASHFSWAQYIEVLPDCKRIEEKSFLANFGGQRTEEQTQHSGL